MFNAKKLNTQLNEYRFLLRGDRFIKKQHLEFSSKKEAKCFLIKFLLVVCLAGTNYTNSELKSTYKKIKKLIKRYSVSSEELPIHPKKQHLLSLPAPASSTIHLLKFQVPVLILHL